MKNNATRSFALYQSLYALILLPFFAYGTYYLLSLGLKSVTVGFLLASANALAVLTQPALAGLADRGIFSLDALICFSLSLFVLSSLGLVLGFAPLLFFALALISLYLINPLLNALSIEWNHRGQTVDFGAAKGTSALSYALFSLSMGSLLLKTGPAILPYTAAFGGSLLLFLIWKQKPAEGEKTQKITIKERPSLFKAQPQLLGLFIGISLVYANYSMFNSYLIHTIRSLGGKESSLGLAVAIAAAAEVPTMVFFSRIMKRFKLRHLLVLSACFFTLKTFIAYLAPGMGVLYFSQFIQMFSFGLYLPTSVYYMASITTHEYRAQAQASITGATTLGSLFAAISGGALIQYLGISAMLLLATLISALGALLIFIFSKRIALEQE